MGKRWVLSEDWKTERLSESLMSSGGEFQSLGAALEWALSPNLQRLGLGLERRQAEVGLRD